MTHATTKLEATLRSRLQERIAAKVRRATADYLAAIHAEWPDYDYRSIDITGTVAAAADGRVRGSISNITKAIMRQVIEDATASRLAKEVDDFINRVEAVVKP